MNAPDARTDTRAGSGAETRGAVAPGAPSGPAPSPGGGMIGPSRGGPALRDLTPSALVMGLLVTIVGFASSFAVVLAGLAGVGASAHEAASGLTAATLAMGAGGVILPFLTRQPIAVAWSTPGAALLATAVVPEGGFAAAVGAFVVCGVMLTLTAFLRPLGRAVAAIPVPIASAMLAGILLPLALAPVRAVAEDWRLGLPIALAWLIGGRVHRLLAVPSALAAFVVVTVIGVELPPGTLGALGGAVGLALAPIAPVFTIEAAIGVGVPLYVVTMASQNIPGLAVLRAHGYEPDASTGFAVTGLLSIAVSPFGGHAVNYAAITAAMCAGEEAGSDPSKRYWAAAVSGFGYLALGLVAGAAALFVSLAPPVLIEAVAGLALVGTFATAALAAFTEPRMREAAAVTFLVAASGIAVLGISGAFWGLLAGLAINAIARR